jgi:hypothetical protein
VQELQSFCGHGEAPEPAHACNIAARPIEAPDETTEEPPAPWMAEGCPGVIGDPPLWVLCEDRRIGDPAQIPLWPRRGQSSLPGTSMACEG